MKNIFYFYNINAIGGVETFFYNLARKYKNWDITIYYQVGDWKQIERLRKYVRVRKYAGEKIVCDKAFFNFNLDIIQNVEAKEYIQIEHGDYKAMGIWPNDSPLITRRLGVSQLVCDTFEEVTGNHVDLVYNPIHVEKPKKLLRLISATRLTSEKGKGRMEILARMLDENEIPYTWDVFTDDIGGIANENIVYHRPRLNLENFVAASDYLVQLSDNEGYCYSVAESLCLGTPVIVTDCPVFRELGVKDGKNGFILPFDMSTVPIKKIYKGLPPFEYKPKEDTWGEILEKGRSTYKQELEDKVYVEVVMEYYDLQLKQMMKPKTIMAVSQARAEVLVSGGAAVMHYEETE